jgi:hypothetical protein
MNHTLQSFFRGVAELPGQFSHWVGTLNDTSFVQIMFVGAVVLTFMIARALR